MRKQGGDTIFLVASLVVTFGWRANADTLPMGATPISGSVAITQVGPDAVATLPLEVPDGQMFVLTDLEVALSTGNGIIQIFAPEDPDNPRLQGLTQGSTGRFGYQRNFQTGLVFSAAPTIKI